MSSRCPHCKSTNVRRSARSGGGILVLFHLLSPYRCRDCGVVFRRINENLYLIAAIIGLVMLPLIVWFTFMGFTEGGIGRLWR